jgi:Fe-Mn family superoxide dismutase
MSYELPKLPYGFDALEPYIDAKTMEIHHDKHHAIYVTKLNEAVSTIPEIAGKPIEELLTGLNSIPENIRQAVRNHGGGHANHTLFWRTLGPGGGGEPSGKLAEAIHGTFSTFESFKEKLSAAAINRFGSGWGWLVFDKLKGLEILSTANQDSPLLEGKIPLLGIDVWEHAYYLKYQNKRADYVQAIWNVINWKVVEEFFGKL